MSVKKNFIYNTIYQIFIVLLPIITVPYISRVLGPNGVGDYSYTAAYAQYFVLLGMTGISIYGNRQIAYKKNNIKDLSKEFFSIYGLQLVTTTISLFIYILIFVVFNKENRILYLVQSIIILATIFDISWFFIGYEDMKSVVVRNTIVKIIGVISIFIWVKKPSDVIVYSVIIAGSNFIGQIIMWLNLKGKVIFCEFNFNKSIKHLKPAIILFIPLLAIQIYTLLDKTMLGAMTNVSQVGLYENSQKTIKLALTLVTSLGTVMLPRMSSLYSEGRLNKLKNTIYKSFDFVNFMVFPMTLGLIAISNNFSKWFYGETFNGINILLKVGSFLMIAIGWGSVLGPQVLIPMKKEKEYTISIMLGAMINFVLNIIFIKKFQAVGTTVSSVIAEFSVTGIQMYYLRNILNTKTIINGIIKPLISSIIMFVIITMNTVFFNDAIIDTIIQILIGVSVYLLVMYLLKDNFIKEGIGIIRNKIIQNKLTKRG
ncbi:TPA: flippase [Clostridium perfringens]|nr:flippase [Clostridium perfringens]